MIKTVYFIRHGMTEPNMRKCYLGSTDAPLTEESLAEIKSRNYPKADTVVSSPMLRCRQTAEAIYGSDFQVYEDLRECDFGDFENKNHKELLKENPYYQTWLDSGGTLSFPHGEDITKFGERVCRCFDTVINSAKGNSIAFVIHGGTIKAIFDKYLDSNTEFFFWTVKNGDCVECEFDGEKLIIGKSFSPI